MNLEFKIGTMFKGTVLPIGNAALRLEHGQRKISQ